MVVTLEPKGFRDVYWCYVGNEPGIIQYRNDRPQCSVCNWVSDDVVKSDKVFLGEHEFICHILKPKSKSKR